MGKQQLCLTSAAAPWGVSTPTLVSQGSSLLTGKAPSWVGRGQGRAGLGCTLCSPEVWQPSPSPPPSWAQHLLDTGTAIISTSMGSVRQTRRGIWWQNHVKSLWVQARVGRQADGGQVLRAFSRPHLGPWCGHRTGGTWGGGCCEGRAGSDNLSSHKHF